MENRFHGRLRSPCRQPEWRQVLGAEALEVEVFGLDGLRLEEEEVEGLRPGGHGFLLLEEDLVVGPVDVGHEVGRSGVVLVEDAAPHDVEHRVGEVPDVAAAVGGEQAVAGCKPPLSFGAFFDIGEHCLLQGRGQLEVGLELDDPRMDWPSSATIIWPCPPWAASSKSLCTK